MKKEIRKSRADITSRSGMFKKDTPAVIRKKDRDIPSPPKQRPENIDKNPSPSQQRKSPACDREFGLPPRAKPKCSR